MEAFDEIAYSDEGNSGRDIFLAEFSDVMFYFEDSDHESVYEKLISMILPAYLTDSVICLKGKGNVIKKASEKNDVGRPRIFVVDKDFDDLLGLKKEYDGLIYLDRFCLENYLVCITAILGVVTDRFSMGITAAHNKCRDFDTFYLDLQAKYISLTRLFLVARRNRVHIQTTKTPVEELVTGGALADILPTSIIENYRRYLLASAVQDSDWITEGVVLDSLLDSAFGSEDEFVVSKNLCGKHILGLVLKYVEMATDVSLAEISITSLYMDVMGRVRDLRDRFGIVTVAIESSVAMQRRALHTV